MTNQSEDPVTLAAVRLPRSHVAWVWSVMAIIVIVGSIALVFWVGGKFGQ